VGKSSLLCALCENKKLARVSKLPGRTRAVNVFEARPGKWLVDLPGYGFAVAPEKEWAYWPKMIGRYLSERPQLKMVYVLLEAERGVGKFDLSLLRWLAGKNIPARLVGTKVDRIAYARHPEFRRQMAQSLGLLPEEVYWVSAEKGNGLKELRADVMDMLGLT